MSLNFTKEEFLKNNFNGYIVNLFKVIHIGMYKADLWRLCKLYIHGGVYSDVDLVPYINIDTLAIIKMLARPNQYSEFNYLSKQWEDPSNLLEIARKEYKPEVNRLAGDKILLSYPTYRQINYNREPTAPATIEMNLWIDAIRAESNLANSSIDSAIDLATIEGIVDGFKAYLAGL